MAWDNLQDFMRYLEQKQLLHRISQPICTDLQMTEIQRRLLEQQGGAVLFENPVARDGRSFDMPVLVNLFGTTDRVAKGISFQGTPCAVSDLREFGQILAFLRQPQPPKSLRDVADLWPVAKMALNMRPSSRHRAPCQEVIWRGDEIDLSRLPIQGCWPGEPAPLITWPLVVTKGQGSHEQEEARYNLGIYRMQVTGRNTTLMRWLKHRGGALHYANWKQKQREPMPAAAVIGCDPGTILAAVTPVPDNLSEYQFAGLLRGKRLELTDCVSIPLQVPAHAEIVLEGYVDLNHYGDEGPYGDHTGYYNNVESFPVFTITAVTMRRKAVYLSTFTGRPPDEPSVLGEALNEIFIPLLQQQFPEIIDFWLPPEGCSYRIAVVSIRKAYAGHAKRIMMGVWSYLRQFLYTKWVIVVDDDINVRDWKDVMWAISTRMDPVRDMTMVQDTPIDYLDFASPHSGLGGKVGLDATNKLPPETNREWGVKLDMDAKTKQEIDDLWQDLGLDSY